jgi:hypothetical protein
MNIRGFVRRAGLTAAVLAASLWVVPSAFAHSHLSVGIGISVPGISVDAGNCWRCGYWAPPPPVYYAPAYPAPVYYSAPAVVYYAPRPGYYGNGYYSPRYRHYDHGYYDHRGWHHRRDGYYRRGH